MCYQGFAFDVWDVNLYGNGNIIGIQKTYKVVFDLDGGTRTGGGELSQRIVSGAAVAPIVEREGYTFKEWDKTFENITEDIVIKALWEAQKFTVTFNLNGGERTGGGELTQTINYGFAAIEPEIKKDGYVFGGWDKEFNTITEDMTITAIWNPAATQSPTDNETKPGCGCNNNILLIPYAIIFVLGLMAIRLQKKRTNN